LTVLVSSKNEGPSLWVDIWKEAMTSSKLRQNRT
jgi:hypothetical protein